MPKATTCSYSELATYSVVLPVCSLHGWVVSCPYQLKCYNVLMPVRGTHYWIRAGLYLLSFGHRRVSLAAAAKLSVDIACVIVLLQREGLWCLPFGELLLPAAVCFLCEERQNVPMWLLRSFLNLSFHA